MRDRHMAKESGKPRKKQKKPRLSDTKQFERFKETARKLGVDESEENFSSAFQKMVPPKRRP
jgi:hypothetical protein